MHVHSTPTQRPSPQPPNDAPHFLAMERSASAMICRHGRGGGEAPANCMRRCSTTAAAHSDTQLQGWGRASRRAVGRPPLASSSWCTGGVAAADSRFMPLSPDTRFSCPLPASPRCLSPTARDSKAQMGAELGGVVAEQRRWAGTGGGLAASWVPMVLPAAEPRCAPMYTPPPACATRGRCRTAPPAARSAS